MTQDKDQCYALVNVVMGINSSITCKKFLACVTHCSLLKNAVFHGVSYREKPVQSVSNILRE
jgi:hypothetical protein